MKYIHTIDIYTIAIIPSTFSYHDSSFPIAPAIVAPVIKDISAIQPTYELINIPNLSSNIEVFILL